MGTEPTERMRFALPIPRRVVSTALIASLAFGGLAQGGYHSRDFQLLLALIAATSAMALVAGLRPRLGAWVFAAGFLALSTVLSALDAQALPRALPTLGLLAAMAAVTAIVDRLDDEGAIQVSFGLTVLGLLVATTGWIGVVFRNDPWGRVSDGLWRGSSSLTYSNAAASLIGAILLITVARAVGDRPRRAHTPPATAGATQPDSPLSAPDVALAHTIFRSLTIFSLLCGLLVTQSRAGIAATALGGLILALRLGVGRTIARLLVPGLAGLASSAVVVAGSSTELDARPMRAIAAFALGTAVVALAPVIAQRMSHRTHRGPRRPLAKVMPALGLGLFLVVGAVLAADGAFGEIVERRLTLSSNTASGEVVFFGDRSHEWQAAADEFRGRPLLGVGPGQLQLRWQEDDGRQYFATFVHNEYLELAATHGLVGLLAAFLGAALVADEIRRNRTATAVHERWGAYAALITLLAHSGLDYLWHLPLLPIVMSAIVGLLVREDRSGRSETAA